MVMERISAGPPNHFDVSELARFAIEVIPFAWLIQQFPKSRHGDHLRALGSRRYWHTRHSFANLAGPNVALSSEWKGEASTRKSYLT